MKRSRRAGNSSTPPGADAGYYIVMNGKRMELERHPTDFSALAPAELLNAEIADESTFLHKAIGDRVGVEPFSAGVARVSVADAQDRDRIMDEIRRECVAHHIYRVKETEEEVAIDNRIFLALRSEDPRLLDEIINEYHLVPVGRMGGGRVLHVTKATGRNPLKAANEIARRGGVKSCAPQVLIPLQTSQISMLDSRHLFRGRARPSSDLVTNADPNPAAGLLLAAPPHPVHLPEFCKDWRSRHVNSRVRTALSKWATEPLSNITSSRTLASLAKGVPWDVSPFQQQQLINQTNAESVFAPYSSTLDSNLSQLPGATTVAQWEDIVWENQRPETACFIPGSE